MKLNKKHILLFAAFCITIISLEYFIFQKENSPENFVIINDKSIVVDIADTPTKQYQGLSGKKELLEHTGMLFLFDQTEIRDFTNRGMLFSFDIIWINNNIIEHITKNIKPPNGETELFNSIKSVNKVLELPGGYCDKYNINIGDIVEYRIYP